jgi:hypothetical protein
MWVPDPMRSPDFWFRIVQVLQGDLRPRQAVEVALSPHWPLQGNLGRPFVTKIMAYQVTPRQRFFKALRRTPRTDR